MALIDGVTAFWKLDETSTGAGAVTRNDSVGTNHLTDNNTCLSTTGKVGDGVQLTAANVEHLSRASNATLQTGDIDFTISAWVYLDSVGATRTVVAKADAGAANQEWYMRYITGTTRFEFAVQESGGSAKTVSAVALGTPSLATWYLLVAWYDSTNNTINIQGNNGTVNQTTTVNPPGTTTGTFRIGLLQAGTQPWDGRIDAVGFWKRILTDDERTTLYRSGVGLEYPFTVTTDQAVSATGTFTASIVKQISKTLSATGSWLATLTATFLEAFRPTSRIATHPAEDRTAVVPARVVPNIEAEEE
jgi:hypothetical protein